MRYIAQLKRVAVACSGGTDSALLLWAAVEAIGCDNVIAVAVHTEVSITRELDSARAFAAGLGVPLNIIDVFLLSNPLFASNPRNRCYICKKAMLVAIKEFALSRGIVHILEGTNASDCIADRPGFVAVAEAGAISPLRECGLTKADVREVSRKLGLDTWDAPSNSCLATRFPYGDMLTAQHLSLVQKVEDFLVNNGIRDVRVRVGGHDE